MSTLDDFFGNAPNDDRISPNFRYTENSEYPDAPASGRVSTCWTTMAERPEIGQRVQAYRFWYVVSEVGDWEAADPENGIEDAGWFVRLVSPLLKETK